MSAGAAVLPGAAGEAIELGWREFTPSGIPVSAWVGAIAAGPGGLVAVGADNAADQTYFVVWNSADVEAWSEVYRSEKPAIRADVVPAGGGFAVIGTTCIVPTAVPDVSQRNRLR